MKILLVYTLYNAYTIKHPFTSFSLDAIHIGISYISSFLKQQGHSTQLLVLPSFSRHKALRMLAGAVEEYSPQVAAFTVVSTQYPFVKYLASHMKQHWPGIYLVAGGAHVSMCPGYVLNDPFDAICIGEGELPLAELANQLREGRRPRKIKNLWIKQDDGTLEKNPTREFLANLDMLPFPDREIWAPWVHETAIQRHVVLLGRGCPFDCTYCSHHITRNLAAGEYVRFRSPDNILAEIKDLASQDLKIETIYLETETILLNKQWLMSLCDCLSEFNRSHHHPIEYACNIRICAQCKDETIFAALSEANVKTLQFGLETGSESLRQSILKRSYTNEEFLSTVKLVKKYGIAVNLHIMLGIPGETKEDHEQTIRLTRKINPNRSIISIFYPYPGTSIYGKCKAEGLLDGVPLDVPRERKIAILDLPTFRRQDIQKAYYLFDFRTYKGIRPFHFRLRRLIRIYLGASQHRKRPFIWLLPLWILIKARLGILRKY
jgi:anaerobic magnesium-protoporphyrin IX monomethyl ester cyclase